MKTLTATLFFFAVSCSGGPALHLNVPHLFTEAGGQGSGVVIVDGWVLTAQHLGPVVGELERHDHPDLDLSLIRLPGLTGRVEFGPVPQFDDPLTALGWHDGDWLVRTAGFAGQAPGVMSCPVIPGCSGGAVLDSEGRLIGIVESVYMMHARDRRTGTPTPFFLPLPHLSWYASLTPDVQAWITNIITR